MPTPDARLTAPLEPPASGTIVVAFLLSPGAEVVDFTGPWGVFDYVLLGADWRKPFDLYTVAADTMPVRVSGGMLWAQVLRGDAISTFLALLAAAALAGGLLANHRGLERPAFTGTGAAIILAVASLFWALFPDVMPSSTDPAFSLTTTNAASTPYTLGIMTVVAVVFTPLVLLYQGWTYWVFRKRISVAPPPADG